MIFLWIPGRDGDSLTPDILKFFLGQPLIGNNVLVEK